ncbi:MULTISPECIES: inorganic phosphate transporter [unclassified Methanoregula]|uniref:inorganic phosphate transporter n=1 Tax=unclassified Methanoregula TaxID=2649730 RepID=UPI0009CFD944|nr:MULTISPECIES: inorganic phosphate transporter [unclassified Methanoregula]OPX62965.1 MAG: Phosphate transporter family protein [Methanoregula sp. PtaB.Bin085]OPY35178.1 MAG: Phosphate transporter family protein [Methanoregula sp. PtaU1.Bin006]
MTGIEPIILFGIILALALNFVNGLNDASHSIATVVATKALSPAKAVLLTALCNLAGPYLFTTAVAATIGTAVIGHAGLTPLSITVAMGTAIMLVFVATRSGIPISSSHAMVGGLLGAGMAVAGLSVIIMPSWGSVTEVVVYGIAGAVIGAIALGLFTASFHEDARFGAMLGALCGASLVIPIMMLLGLVQLSGLLAIVLFIFISPVIGMVGAFVFDVIVSHLFRHSRRNRMRRIFQPLHVLACLIQATAHGANDGQHAVGVITALLVSSGFLLTFAVPDWVLLSSAIAIGLGTCFGGWRVVDKMAREITKIRPYQGFCAATASSAILAAVTHWGIPVSSTHSINGAIVGVGATRGKSAVQWRVVQEMVTAWIITIPLAVVVAFVMYYTVDLFLVLL